MNFTKIFFLSLVTITVNIFYTNAQLWETEIIASLPAARSNNVVETAVVDGVPYVYSFSGIDTTKVWSGISNKAYRYNTETAVWDTIPNLPMNINVIAAGASTVGNKIYIIGGYTVLQNNNEISSNQIFEYDPIANSYTEKTNLPIPIDDHIQSVWRDSLIYVVTGWSNTTNISNVQIYDPANDTWTIGTSVPNNSDYKVFGGSGAFIGDTLYYAGGTGIIGFNFNLVPFFRKGVVNPENPAEIMWSIEENDLALGYRMGVTTFEDQVLWIGGSLVSYNYDGIAYNGSGGVPPTDRILSYSPTTGVLTDSPALIPPTMDLRGIAKIKEGIYYVIGGMTEDQTVSDQCFILRDATVLEGLFSVKQQNLEVYQTLASHEIKIILPEEINTQKAQLRILTTEGKVVLQQKINTTTALSTIGWTTGIYAVSVSDGERYWSRKIVHE